ncbi:MAG TPA: polyprenyl synthetase family protein [Thermodesulfobacteriota bacterium]|nr:polyprenyl synthetase family protein [Deltaproteobacteria bacterium]HNR12181.1 polyprenyl synthetase family protein [Thermodesulfobacteriota bacterium]HQQ68412.1 polyprenyl synthetase family protein [Candidatus Cloacimonadota bacterium]
MDVKAVYDLVADDLQGVENELEKRVNSADVALISTIGRHILRSGGKRFRPLMLILAARACGYTGRAHIVIGSILEFIHTATLMHDDVVDEATIRRGNSSVNSVWGNKASILVGDFFVTQSFYLIAQTRSWRALDVLTEAVNKLARGEILDLVNEGNIDISEEDYFATVSSKTASLFEAATHIGAVLADVDREQELALRDYGFNVGIAFQLMDDTLDFIATEDQFGKTIGKDLEEGKVTLPIIHTLRTSSPADREVIISAIQSPELSNGIVQSVTELVTKYHGIDYTVDLSLQYVASAKKALSLLPLSPEKDALLSLADYAITRKR